MRCTDPRTVGFKTDGKTIAWSLKDHSKEYANFQLPCGQCLNCRLDYARTWAIRCVHEAKMHAKSSFITLTFSDAHLGDNKLNYTQFQLFMKRLRKDHGKGIGFFATGEYGTQTKRQHWHAIIFGWDAEDKKYQFTTDRGDKVYTSKILDELWSFGDCKIGDVTFESAGYCARYAAKDLCGGKNHVIGMEPISKKSNKNAIGKKWLEKFHDDIFNHGKMVIKKSDGSYIPIGDIPRYYIKWLQKHQPQKWERYVTETKEIKTQAAIKQAIVEQSYRPYSNTKKEAERLITEKTIQQRLMKYLKL